MRPPRLNRPLALEAPERVSDGAGGFTVSWQLLGTHWAEVTPGTGREAGAPGGAVSRVPVRIVLWASPAGSPMRPAADQRFVDGGRVYTILSVTERDKDGRYLVCQAREETAV